MFNSASTDIPILVSINAESELDVDVESDPALGLF
jgi:hypothetical protein